MSKHVLVAAYYFPPYADVSGVRVTKFCKYLPEYGWHPIVLTVDPSYYRGKVVAQVPREVEGMEVQRVPYIRVPGATILIKLAFPLIIFHAAWRSRRRLSAVCLVGSPFHPFAVAAAIAPLLRIPILLDFRDSWSTNPMFLRYPRRWQRWLVGHLRAMVERIGIAHASVVSFATSGLVAEFSHRFPHRREKFHAVENGFDPEDFEGLEPENVCRETTLILTGKFGYYTPEVVGGLMQALRATKSLHFLYVGGEAEEVATAAHRAGVAERVTTMPFQPLERMLRLIKGADYGLVTHSEPYAVGTKIFDYLALGKPVLCFVPQDSAVATTFAGLPGVIVQQGLHTPAQVWAGLQCLLQGPGHVQPEVVEHFSRRDSTRKLAGLLDGISADAAAREVPAAG